MKPRTPILRKRRPFGYRVKRIRKNASNHPGLALAKGSTRADYKRDRHQAEVAQIARVREELFARTNVCACCGQTERQGGWRPHEMNEDPARSKTRGLPPEERFNARICMRLCPGCHHGYTANQLRCVALSADGWLGDYDVERKVDGAWAVVREVRQ